MTTIIPAAVSDGGQRGAEVTALQDERPQPLAGAVGTWKQVGASWFVRVQGAYALDILHAPAVQAAGGGQEEEVIVDLHVDNAGRIQRVTA